MILESLSLIGFWALILLTITVFIFAALGVFAIIDKRFKITFEVKKEKINTKAAMNNSVDK